MSICKRCNGYVSTTYTHSSNSDPFCINCGCSYPELNTFVPNNNKRKGTKETIRYTGKNHTMKDQLGYITYAEHPNKGSLYPMLIIECPTCTKKTESITNSTNPYALNNERQPGFKDGYKVARKFIKCPTGHLFKLKVNKQGMYSWE